MILFGIIMTQISNSERNIKKILLVATCIFFIPDCEQLCVCVCVCMDVMHEALLFF